MTFTSQLAIFSSFPAGDNKIFARRGRSFGEFELALCIVGAASNYAIKITI